MNITYFRQNTDGKYYENIMTYFKNHEKLLIDRFYENLKKAIAAPQSLLRSNFISYSSLIINLDNYEIYFGRS